MAPSLRTTILAAIFATTVAGSASAVAADGATTLHWRWSGAGHFPQEFQLTIYSLPDGRSAAWLDELGPLKSVGGWGELQRYHRMIAGSVRAIANRKFIVFAELDRAAEFTIGSDGVLHLYWFYLAVDAPLEADLLAGRQAQPTSGLPEEMTPG